MFIPLHLTPCHFTLFLFVYSCMQEVLTQLTSRLASQLNDLTIQVVKDDWSFPRPTHVSSSPLTGTYNSRIASSTTAMSPSPPPSVYTLSMQSQLVGGGGQVKGHSHMHSPSPPPHHHGTKPSPTLVAPNPHTATSHLQTV